jgi:hypothetical protein
MHTITLELLRHGPAHNQLLSPLTPYLALCENHGAVTLNVPFEHNQFLHRLDALSYRESEDARIFQIKDTAAILGKMLGQVPGLTAETSKQSSQAQPLTHLRLIISASELALLPFELALSPDGLPGAGQYLLLQSQMPVCLTREVRRAPDDNFKWPTRPPHILFIAAAPPKVGDIPLKAHLLALRRAIEPWVRYCDPTDEQMRQENLARHFVFLPNASIEAIQAACSKSDFTHVHILAHGIQYSEGKDRRYALALHDARDTDRMDLVDGARLATALRPATRPGGHSMAQPAMVTMASCDAGNVGSVAGAGASIAHALHEAGIGVVLAAQFPLSFEGSVRMVEILYEDLLWGKDPREVIHDLRRRLFSQIRTRHDWASLTAYLALPNDFETQLSTVKIKQALGSINAAMSYADQITRQESNLIKSGQGTDTKPGKVIDNPGKVIDRMDRARARLKNLIEEIPAEGSEIYGLLASTEKRQAEVWFRGREFWRQAQDGQAASERYRDYAGGPEGPVDPAVRSIRLLGAARDHYWDSFQADRRSHWAVTQYLSLAAVLARIQGEPGKDEPQAAPRATPARAKKSNVAQTRPERSLTTLWALARMHSLYDLNHADSKSRCWAHGNLLELYLLSLLPEFGVQKDPTIDAERLAIEHADKLIDIGGPRSFEAYSTRRQIMRYIEWYGNLTGGRLSSLTSLAQRIFDRFPARVETWTEQ